MHPRNMMIAWPPPRRNVCAPMPPAIMRELCMRRRICIPGAVSRSLDDAADAAGVGVGTVYRRFANKQELITAVFDRTVAEGVLRPGIAAFDLFAMVTMGEAMASFAKPLNSELWRRYLALMLGRVCADHITRLPLTVTPLHVDEAETAKAAVFACRRE